METVDVIARDLGDAARIDSTSATLLEAWYSKPVKGSSQQVALTYEVLKIGEEKARVTQLSKQPTICHQSTFIDLL